MGRWALIVQKTRLQRIICSQGPAPFTLTPPPGGGASASHAVNSRSRWVRAKLLRLVLIMWLSCRGRCAVFAKGPRAHSKYRLKLETQYGSVCHTIRNMSSLITNIFSWFTKCHGKISEQNRLRKELYFPGCDSHRCPQGPFKLIVSPISRCI